MKKTILTIESAPNMRHLIRMTLEYMGFQVLEAVDGEDGLHIVRHQRPDLVLIDVCMPGMSGLAVCQAIRVEPQFSAIPVVMLSSVSEEVDIAAGMKRGANAYLVKPFQPTELIELVTRLIEEVDPGFAAIPAILC